MRAPIFPSVGRCYSLVNICSRNTTQYSSHDCFSTKRNSRNFCTGPKNEKYGGASFDFTHFPLIARHKKQPPPYPTLSSRIPFFGRQLGLESYDYFQRIYPELKQEESEFLAGCRKAFLALQRSVVAQDLYAVRQMTTKNLGDYFESAFKAAKKEGTKVVFDSKILSPFVTRVTLHTTSTTSYSLMPPYYGYEGAYKRIRENSFVCHPTSPLRNHYIFGGSNIRASEDVTVSAFVDFWVQDSSYLKKRGRCYIRIPR